jgi:hypothetical protein
VSALSSASLSASLPASTLPPIDPAYEPQSVRKGNTAAKNAYQEGLAFEDVLVNELSQELTATVPGLSGSDSGSDDGLGGTDSSSSGLGDSGLGAYASLLPQALTNSVMSGGGTGIAMQIAQSIDPALGEPTKK